MDEGRAAIVTALPDAAELFAIGRELCPWVRSRYSVEQVLVEHGVGEQRRIDYAMFFDGSLCGYGRCDVLDLVTPGTAAIDGSNDSDRIAHAVSSEEAVVAGVAGLPFMPLGPAGRPIVVQPSYGSVVLWIADLPNWLPAKFLEPVDAYRVGRALRGIAWFLDSQSEPASVALLKYTWLLAHGLSRANGGDYSYRSVCKAFVTEYVPSCDRRATRESLDLYALSEIAVGDVDAF